MWQDSANPHDRYQNTEGGELNSELVLPSTRRCPLHRRQAQRFNRVRRCPQRQLLQLFATRVWDTPFSSFAGHTVMRVRTVPAFRLHAVLSLGVVAVQPWHSRGLPQAGLDRPSTQEECQATQLWSSVIVSKVSSRHRRVEMQVPATMQGAAPATAAGLAAEA